MQNRFSLNEIKWRVAYVDTHRHTQRHFGNMQCNCLYLLKDTLSKKKKKKRHTSKLHAARLNHAPPSISLYFSSLHIVTRCHLKKVECRDFLMQTSPVIPYLKMRKTYSSTKGNNNSKK